MSLQKRDNREFSPSLSLHRSHEDTVRSAISKAGRVVSPETNSVGIWISDFKPAEL